ncbi:MAG: hypothetical protein METHAR1v1_1850006 [Methanothrix sp.]|nr:MAG: hypothetical protein METHAR1v1_1850006 [Methanothrix sp.]
MELLGFGWAFHGGEELLFVAEPAKPHLPRDRELLGVADGTYMLGPARKIGKIFSSASPEGSWTSAMHRQFVSIIRYQALQSPYPTTSEYLI